MTLIHSVRTKILVIVFAFLALAGAAFALYSISTTINYKRLRLQAIEKTIAFETEKVNKTIAELERSAVFFALEALLLYESPSREIVEISVMEYLRDFPTAVGGGFWFEPYTLNKDILRAGVYAYYDKQQGKVRLDDTFIMEEYDYHNRDWYLEISGAATRPYQVAWSKPYTDDTGSFSLMTTAGAGVFDQQGKLLGISTVDWEIEKVVEELIAIEPTKNSFVLLCVPGKDSIISCTVTKSSVGAPLEDLPWDINAASFEFEGARYLRFSRDLDNGWLLSVQVPVNEIFAEVESRNRRFLLISLFVSVMTLWLAHFLISKLINTPIKRLSSDVSQFALGNLDIHIDLDTKDELGMLADTFNKMAADLKHEIERRTREKTEKDRINTELSVATEIQASMLPRIFPPFPDRTEFEIYASMLPEKAVGGDFYDFYFVDRDTLVVVIADVSGKGVPAALFMVIAKTLIKNCSACKSPRAVFESVNKKLCETNDANMFVTAFMGFYNIPSGKLTYVNAGHNPPIIKKRGASTCEFLRTEPRFVLAWMENAMYIEKEAILEPGDLLYLYTDGVTEAMNSARDLFSEERLLAAVNKYADCKPRDLLYAIKGEIDIFSGDAEQADDITMLALRINDPAKITATVPQNPMKELKVVARKENLAEVLDFVNEELEQNNCPDNVRNELNIAVEEIFLNIANYAFKPAMGNVAVFISAKEKINIRFEDTGRPYNPIEQKDPDLAKAPADREVGGLGVFLVKNLVDAIEYSRVDNKNILEITKSF